MSSKIIRLAKPAEATLLSNLALRSKGHWGYDAEFLSSCKDELTYSESQLKSPTCCFKVAELKGHSIIGFFALTFLGNDHPELDALFIDPDFIGQSWGKLLLSAAIDVSKEHKAKSIKLEGDPFPKTFI